MGRSAKEKTLSQHQFPQPEVKVDLLRTSMHQHRPTNPLHTIIEYNPTTPFAP
jgi:hypothetical protein